MHRRICHTLEVQPMFHRHIVSKPVAIVFWYIPTKVDVMASSQHIWSILLVDCIDQYRQIVFGSIVSISFLSLFLIFSSAAGFLSRSKQFCAIFLFESRAVSLDPPNRSRSQRIRPIFRPLDCLFWMKFGEGLVIRRELGCNNLYINVNKLLVLNGLV